MAAILSRPQCVKIVLPISKERWSFKISSEISRNIEALEMLHRVMIKCKRFSDSMHIILIWWLLMHCRLFGVGHLITVTSSHDERDGVWNHRRLECLFNHLFRCRTNKTSKNSTSLAFVRGIHHWPVDSPRSYCSSTWYQSKCILWLFFHLLIHFKL